MMRDDSASAGELPLDPLPNEIHDAQNSTPSGGATGFGAGLTAAPSDGEDRPRRSRRKRRSRSGARGESSSGDSDGRSTAVERPPREEVPADGAEAGDAPRRKKRGRRGRRGGAGRSAASRAEPPAGAEDAPARSGPPADAEAQPRDGAETREETGAGADVRKKRRRRRGGRGRGRAREEEQGGAVEIDWLPGEDDGFDGGPDADGAAAAGGSRKLASRRAGRPDDDAPRDDEDDEREEPAGSGRKKRKRRGGRRRKAGGEADGRAEEREEDDDDRPRRAEKAGPRKPNVILVNAADPEETRVALVEDGVINEFQMTVKKHKTFVNDIYRGKVVNLEPAIGAAFIDFGQGRNGFLHTSDVLSAYGDKDWSLDKLLTTRIEPDEWQAGSPERDVDLELGEGEDKGGKDGKEGRQKRADARRQRSKARPRLPISSLLQRGQSVVVQVTKDAIGDKGPTLTTYISIPGRYLVLMPSMARTGVSRKIEDEKERRRLKRILRSLKIPDGMGVIVRTAGVGRTKTDLKRDLDYLLALWDDFGRRLTIGRGPMPLYEESDVAIRTLRDLANEDTEAVWVDDERFHERMLEFTRKLMPEMVDLVKLHEGQRPLFHTFNAEQDFERIFARRVELPSGGSIVFDQTEALVAIDVNSGKTRNEGFNFEEIALTANLEAVPEIARQIRLRDLGGIIVCDFIDMQRQGNRRAVEKALRDELARDRARSKVGRISQFGLLELTRQRLGPGMSKMLFRPCPDCRGSGLVRTEASRAGALLRRLGSSLTLKGFTRVEVRARPEVVDYLERHSADQLRALQERSQRELELVRVPNQAEDSVLRYLRTDGREVRPGGRRKKR